MSLTQKNDLINATKNRDTMTICKIIDNVNFDPKAFRTFRVLKCALLSEFAIFKLIFDNIFIPSKFITYVGHFDRILYLNERHHIPNENMAYLLTNCKPTINYLKHTCNIFTYIFRVNNTTRKHLKQNTKCIDQVIFCIDFMISNNYDDKECQFVLSDNCLDKFLNDKEFVLAVINTKNIRMIDYMLKHINFSDALEYCSDKYKPITISAIALNVLQTIIISDNIEIFILLVFHMKNFNEFSFMVTKLLIDNKIANRYNISKYAEKNLSNELKFTRSYRIASKSIKLIRRVKTMLSVD